MSDVASSLQRDRKRYREYKRRESDGWHAEPAADYNDDPTDMSDSQLENQHDDLLRLQKQEQSAGHSDMARKMAERRNELWKEAKRRDIEDRLL